MTHAQQIKDFDIIPIEYWAAKEAYFLSFFHCGDRDEVGDGARKLLHYLTSSNPSIGEDFEATYEPAYNQP